MPQSQQTGVIRFGVFEVDPQSGTVRKRGVRISLQEQPFRVLLALLEKPGEVVTREELQQQVWTGVAFGDFDHSLNIAINKLRQTLGDSADTPRFVETVPRRGYRFIAPISQNGRAEAPPERVLRTHRVRLAFVAAAILVLVALGALLVRRNRSTNEFELAPSVPLGAYPGNVCCPSISPDGTRVAFAWRLNGGSFHLFDSDIYVKLIGAGEPLRVAQNGEWPAWSPDGRWIAFERFAGDGASILVVPAMGGPERQITNVALGRVIWPGVSLAWSRDSKSLFALDSGPDRLTWITRVSVESGEKVRITSPPANAHGDLAPAVSPDGTTLAFKREVAYALADIYVLPVDGRSKDRTPRRITTEPRPTVGSLAWTPDSRGLVFYSPRSGEPALWQISDDARSRPVLVTGTAHIGSDFALSAQGRLVYCTQNASYHLWRISLGRGIAGPATPVLPVTGRSDYLPQYSPDGKRIAFASNRSGRDEIWVCNEDGSALMQVTSLAAFSGTPRWSPDGAKIAFDSNKTGNWDILVVGSQGGKPLQLTTNRSDDYVPSWSRDGQWVYFASTRTGRTEIWKIAPSGGREFQVTRNGGFNALEAPSGKQLYFTRYLGEGSVWRIALPDGAEEPVGGRLLGRAFEPAVRGLYLVEETSGRTVLKFLEYGSRSETAVATLGRGHVGAMTISPDERTAVYELLDVANSELMLVESFRRKRSGFRW